MTKLLKSTIARGLQYRLTTSTATDVSGNNDTESKSTLSNLTSGIDHLLLEKQIKERLDALDSVIGHCVQHTHGFVGADLQALCRSASLSALARWQRNRLDLNSTEQSEIIPTSPMSEFADLQITPEDLIRATKETRPSALRSFLIEVPNVKWHDIGGQHDAKQQIKEAVEWPLQHPEAFTRMGIRPPKGILLYGPPGCSKTLMAKALATESAMNFIAVKGPELFSKWVGESEQAIADLFRKARRSAPTVVFFDEIDAMAGSRSGGDEGGANGVSGTQMELCCLKRLIRLTEWCVCLGRVLSQLLNELDGVNVLKQVVVVAATNRWVFAQHN